MSGTQSKFIRNASNQENRIHNEKKNQSFEANEEVIQIINYYARILIVIITVFHLFKKLGKNIECVKT